MARPLARDVLKALAESHRLCVNPIPIRRIDTATGAASIIEVPCGATLASKCKPCAERGRKLRQVQIREGWHQKAEPTVKTEAPSQDLKAAILLRCTYVHDRDEAMLESAWAQVSELDEAITELDGQLAGMRVRGRLEHPAKEKKARKARSTRRRQDAPELPRLKVEDRTTGKVYKTKDGKAFQPSTLLTVTLGSHGDVHGGTKVRRGRLTPCQCGKLHGHHDPLLGTPIDPAAYNYRQAALDAIFFAAGLDRFWQNLRRAAGWKAQYAGTVELQKRLAPHAHFAMRGTLPNKLISQVAAATYHQVWWPHFDEPVYTVSKPPVWSDDAQAYVDPKTGEPLQTWEQALKELDEPDATPAYTMRLGTTHATGITPGTKSAERNIRYITKYITKDLTEHASPSSEEQKQHFDRLHQELQTLPCSPTCANWLLYGVQPKDAEPGLNPGRCSGKVHQRKTLGFTGRRVLISRQWSGKTLGDHRADQKDWIRNVLKGQTEEIADPRSGGTYLYELAKPSDPDVPSAQHRLMVAIEARRRWKMQIQQALPPPGSVPANRIGPEPPQITSQP